jgi:ubiquinone/menaquinone biosynthesis C-methylase UbiE
MDGQTNPVDRLFGALTGYQQTAMLKAAIDLGVFTAIAAGVDTVPLLARHCEASERGIRMLCDSLAATNFLVKGDDRYSVPLELSPFVDGNSPIYMASAVHFLASRPFQEAFGRLTEAVRRGGTALSEQGSTEPDHPVWVEFARSMAPLASFSAQGIANLLEADSAPAWKVLDVAAGHGMYGIILAQRNPRARVVALDWKNVLAVAEENARRAGVLDRFEVVSGSAFDVDPGSGYDVVLITNFLHHFDPPTCERFLRRMHTALRPGGVAVTLEFVPEENRIEPPAAATFSLVMLASTPAGDAYTYRQLEAMFRNAGFSRNELREIPPSFERVVLSWK